MNTTEKSLNDFLHEVSQVFHQAMLEDENRQEAWWNTLKPDQQLDALCCVVRRIVKGDVVDRGSYRYVLYDVFGFEPHSYVAAQCAGYLTLHNLIYKALEADQQDEQSL